MNERGRMRFWMARLCMAAMGLGLAGGCTVNEALVDGFYGGISDTVATVVSNALLGQLDDD